MDLGNAWDGGRAGEELEGREVRRRAPRGRPFGRLACAFGLGLATGCISPAVDDLQDFETIPMNRVVPYPDPDELQERTVHLSLRHEEAQLEGADSEGWGIPGGGLDASLEEARGWTRLAVETIALGQGARIEQDAWAGGWNPSGARRAMALTTRFARYEYQATWKRPFKFLWQNEEEVAEKPGTCLHRADVALEIRVQKSGEESGASRIFSLEHAAEETTRSLDPKCPLTPSAKSALFETAMEEALGCLRQPLAKLFAPRGHITAHKRALESDQHLMRASLGAAQGIEPGELLEIRREQRSVTPEGDLARTERVLAVGYASEQVDEQSAWVIVDPGESEEPILDGDLVRPRFEEGLLASLSGPNCQRILSEP